MNFIVTFSQKDRKRDGWVLLTNTNRLEHAKAFVKYIYLEGYLIYEEDKFIEGYFPKGCLATYDLKELGFV